MELSFQLVSETRPGARLAPVFARYWPAYKRWIARADLDDFETCRRQLKHHMPELLPTFEKLHDGFGGKDEVGRFLSLVNPPRMVRACTQLMIDSEVGPVLLRSYDHHPKLFDGIILRSAWNGTSTLAMADCLWGALDGVNAEGLAIALAFGGRNVVGDGFAAPLICRYVLETCATVTEARRALARLPVAMPYTFALLDATGEFITAFLGPDIEAGFVTRRSSTNHQWNVEWPAYASSVETVERLDLIESLVRPKTTLAEAREAFLSTPVWRHNYAKASGTLYVAEYRVAQKTLHLHWPKRTERFALKDSDNRSFSVTLPEPAVK